MGCHRFQHPLFVNTEVEYSIDEQIFPGIEEPWHLSQPAMLILEDQLSLSLEQFGDTMDQSLCYVDAEPDLYSIIDCADVFCSDLLFGNSVDDVIDSSFCSPDVGDARAYPCERWNSSSDWIDAYEISPEFVELMEVTAFDLNLTVESQLHSIQFDSGLNSCQEFGISFFSDSLELLSGLHNRE